jgi:hypothetical protein
VIREIATPAIRMPQFQNATIYTPSFTRPQPLASTIMVNTVDTGGATGGTTPTVDEDATYSIYFDNETGAEVLVNDSDPDKANYVDNDRYSVGAEGMTRDEVEAYGDFADDPAFGTTATRTPLAPRESIVSQADINRAVARGATAKKRDGPIAEPKDMPGYNETLASISSRFDPGVAQRLTRERQDQLFRERTGLEPPSTSLDSTKMTDPYAPLVGPVAPQPPVVEINGSLYPGGWTPTPYTDSSEWENLPPAPTGYYWVVPQDTYIPELVPIGEEQPGSTIVLTPETEVDPTDVSAPKVPLWSPAEITDEIVQAIMDSPAGEWIPDAVVSLSTLWEDVKDDIETINNFGPQIVRETWNAIERSELPAILDDAVNLLPAPIRGGVKEVVPRLIEWSGWAQNEVAEFIFDNYADVAESGKLRLGGFEFDVPGWLGAPISIIDEVSRLADPEGKSLSTAIREGRQGGALDWINRAAFDNTLVGYMWTLGFQVLTDPLTYLPGAALWFRGATGAGRASQFSRGIGRTLDITEGVADLGLGYAAEGLFRAIPRTPLIRRAFAPTNETARDINRASVGESLGELRGATPSRVPYGQPVTRTPQPNVPETEPVDTATIPPDSETNLSIREALLEERATVKESMDQLEKDFFSITTPTRDTRDAFTRELQRHTDYLNQIDEAIRQTPIPSRPPGEPFDSTIPDPTDSSPNVGRAPETPVTQDEINAWLAANDTAALRAAGASDAEIADFAAFEVRRTRTTQPVEPITGEGAQVTDLRGRQIDPNETNPDGGPAAIQTARGPLNVQGVPRRFHAPLRVLTDVNDAPSVQALIDDFVAERIFRDQMDATRGPRYQANPRSALETSETIRQTYDRYVEINPDAIIPPYQPSQARLLGPDYQHMERAIHSPWADTAASRQILTDRGFLLDAVPTGQLTPAQIEALNNYVRLIEEHLYWNRTRGLSADFGNAAARARQINRYLTERSLAYKPRVRRGSGGGQTAQGSTGTPRTAAAPPASSTTTSATGARTGITTPPAGPVVHPYGDVNGYPIIPSPDTRPNAGVIVRIDADTNVVLTPVAVDTVPRRARERFPDATEAEWTEARLLDARVPNPTPHYAPTREQALDLAVEDATAKGLVNDFAGRPANRQTGEALDFESQARQNVSRVRGMPPTGKTRSNLPNGVRIAHAGTIDLGGANAPVWTVTTPEGTATIVKEAGDSYRVSPGELVDETALADFDATPSFETPQAALVEAQMQARYGSASAPVEGPATAPPVPVGERTPRVIAVDTNILDDPAADALESYGRTRNWTEAKRDAIYGLLGRINRTSGQPVIDVGDFSTRAGREQFAKLEDIVRLTDANEGLARGLEGTTGRKRQNLEARINKNRARIATLERDLRMTNRPAVTTPGDTTTSVISEIAKTPPRQRAFGTAVGKLRSLVAADMPVASMPMPAGLQQYDGVIYLEGVPISDKAVVDLTKHVFDNGDTVLDRLSKKIIEYRGNPTMWDGVNPGEILDRAIREVEADYDALLEQLFPSGSKRTTPFRAFGIFTRLTRDSILANHLTGWTRYVITQYLGNLNPSFLTGADNGFSLAKRTITQQKKVRGAIDEMYYNTGANPIRVAEDMTDTERFDMAAGLPPSKAVFDIQTGEFGARRTELGNWYASRNMKQPAWVKAVLGDERIYREGLIADTINRDNIYQITTRRQLAEDTRVFDRNARARLTDAGLDADAVDAAMRSFYDSVDYQWGWKAQDVRTHFSTYLDETISDRLGRDWQNAINTRRKLANSEVTRITFGGSGRTKLDDFLSNFILFHYFQSRQLKFLTVQALKHPAILNFYVNSQEALHDYAEKNPDMPGWLKGSIKVADWLGVSIYLNPTALLQVGSIYGNTETIFEDPEKTWLMDKLDTDIPFLGGKVEDWVFLNPAITQPLNLFGFLSDDQDVNILNTNQWGRLGALGINIGINKGWWGEPGEMIGNPVANFWNQGRDWASGIGLPGSVEVEFVDTANREERKLNALIVDVAIAEGLDPANPDDAALIEAAKQDPNHPFYKEAWGRYITGEAIGIGSKSTPIIASFRPQVRLQDRNGLDLINNQTGWAATDLRNTTDPEAGALKVQTDQFYDLGDSFDPQVDGLYQNLVYGEVINPVTLDGKTYSAKEINSWDVETRKDFAQAFLVDNELYDGWQEYQALQDEFLADPANAEFAQYRSWSGDVRDYPGGIEQYWQDVADNNPNAKRWYENLDPDLTPEEREKALLSQRAFMSVKGLQADYNDPTPIDTNDFDPVNIANGPAKPIVTEPYVSEFEEGFFNDYNNFVEYASEAKPVMDQIMTDWGMDPSIPFNGYTYRTREDLKDEYYSRTGYPYPEPKGAVLDYFQWVAKQPAGSDVSPEAYIEWSNEQYVAKMPAEFNEEIEKGDPTESGFDPIEFVDTTRSKDPGYSWEDNKYFWEEP